MWRHVCGGEQYPAPTWDMASITKEQSKKQIELERRHGEVHGQQLCGMSWKRSSRRRESGNAECQAMTKGCSSRLGVTGSEDIL